MQKNKGLLNFSEEMRWIFDREPIVLFDVGASGAPPRLWRELAPISYYVGFDPDLRELREDNSYGFNRFIIFNKAVVDTDCEKHLFHLTVYPGCSSLLKPNIENLRHYSYTELFEVQEIINVPAMKIGSALSRIEGDRIDWLKLDSQGKDMDLFCSLDETVQNRLLVIDIEPGVTNFYEGENTFSQTHDALLKKGFWLSKINLQYNPRISKKTRERLASQAIDFKGLPGNPTAVEAQYFRTLEHLEYIHASQRDYLCHWLLAMLNSNYGFALDIAVLISAQDRKLGDSLVQRTREQIIKYYRTRKKPLADRLRALVPAKFKTPTRRLVNAVQRRASL